MIRKWFSVRDPATTVVSHTLEDEGARVYAKIEKGGRKGWLVTVPPGIPFSRSTLDSAKKDAEWVLDNRK